MAAYYNEHDPYAAAWLRNLIAAGLIAPGEVDERDILDVQPSDLAGFSQVHFFAGIGGWSCALRLAGWPDDRPIWTASCPCQPFSAAGKGSGFADERHLWPALHWLIERGNPPFIVGEQVASPDGLAWLDLVSADCEGSGYAFRAVDLCAAGVGAPHIRQRLYWAAWIEDAKGHGRQQRRPESSGRSAVGGCGNGGMGHAHHPGPQGHPGHGGAASRQGSGGSAPPAGVSGGLADTPSGRIGDEREQRSGEHGFQPQDGSDVRQGHQGPRAGLKRVADTEHDRRGGSQGHLAEPRGDQQNLGVSDRGHSISQGQPPTGPTDGFWRDADWLGCRDGKWRPVEPGTFPLAHGVPARMGRLRAYGNAIVPQVAAQFIRMMGMPQ